MIRISPAICEQTRAQSPHRSRGQTRRLDDAAHKTDGPTVVLLEVKKVWSPIPPCDLPRRHGDRGLGSSGFAFPLFPAVVCHAISQRFYLPSHFIILC